MKSVKFVLIALAIIFSGCQDSLFNPPEANDYSEQNELKKATVKKEVTLKIRARLSSTPNNGLPLVTCVPVEYDLKLAGGGWVEGFSNLIGKVDKNNSTYVRDSCNLGPGPTQVTSWYHGQIAGFSGDYYNIVIMEISDASTMTFTGYTLIYGGTGKFEGADGYVEMVNGTFDESGNASWEGYGTITLPKP